MHKFIYFIDSQIFFSFLQTNVQHIYLYYTILLCGEYVFLSIC